MENATLTSSTSPAWLHPCSPNQTSPLIHSKTTNTQCIDRTQCFRDQETILILPVDQLTPHTARDILKHRRPLQDLRHTTLKGDKGGPNTPGHQTCQTMPLFKRCMLLNQTNHCRQLPFTTDISSYSAEYTLCDRKRALKKFSCMLEKR